MNSNIDVCGSQQTNKYISQNNSHEITAQLQQSPRNRLAAIQPIKAAKMILLALITLSSLIALSVPNNKAVAQSPPLAIPAESDWVDRGLIFTEGGPGEWDYILWGGFAGCVTKKNGQFYLYYQGSDGYDDNAGTVTHRAIGLATSSDGLNFQKDQSNPVITHSPTNNIEEGAVSCGVSMNGGQMTMYYGANTAASSRSSAVNADGMAATSSDGRNFTNQGVALNHNNPNLWGSGDEVFPVMSLKAPETNKWIVYYIPNGVSQSGLLGVAWGNTLLGLTNSAGVTSPGGGNISTWGMGGGVVSLQNGTYAVFTNNLYDQRMEARIMNPNAPHQLSGIVESYNFADFSNGVVYFDAAANTWYLFYQNADATAYGVKTAFVGDPANQPPSVSAGPDATVELQNGTATTSLSGTANDDGLPAPPGTTTAAWSVVSGPGSVTFGSPNSLNTTAAMTAEGLYILEIAVTDSQLSTTDTVTITVEDTPTGSTCHLTSAEWGQNSVQDGQKIRLKVFAADCSGGEVAHFDIYELLDGSPSPLLVATLTTAVAGNNQAKVNWIADYNCNEPGIDCPAPENAAVYYFKAYPGSSPNLVVTSPLLSVAP